MNAGGHGSDMAASLVDVRVVDLSRRRHGAADRRARARAVVPPLGAARRPGGGAGHARARLAANPTLRLHESTRSCVGGASISPAGRTPARCSRTRRRLGRPAHRCGGVQRAAASARPRCRRSTRTSSRPTTQAGPTTCFALMRSCRTACARCTASTLAGRDPARRLRLTDRSSSTERPRRRAPSKRSSIHPRFRARRIEVKRRRRTSPRSVELVTLGGARRVCWPSCVPRDTEPAARPRPRRRVGGRAHRSSRRCARVGRSSAGQPMTDLDIDRARARASPRCHGSTPSRSTRDWPGTRQGGRIAERHAVASLAVDAASWLVARRDRACPRDPARPSRPELAGARERRRRGRAGSVDAPSAARRRARRLRHARPAAWLIDIVIADADGTLEARLQNGITASFGSQAHLADKMIGLATVLTRVDLKDLETHRLAGPELAGSDSAHHRGVIWSQARRCAGRWVSHRLGHSASGSVLARSMRNRQANPRTPGGSDTHGR